METPIRVSVETRRKLKCSSFINLDLDVILNHIIPRLDGTTLIALSSTSSELRGLCSDEKLWKKICTDMWPSLLDPIASDVISSFPGGFRSFFSDSFRSIQHEGVCYPPPPLPEIIYAFDVYCKHGPAFISRVRRIDASDQGTVVFSSKVNTPVTVPKGRYYKEWFEEKLRLSWIVIDPSGKRAMNVMVNLINCNPAGSFGNRQTSSRGGRCNLELKYRVVLVTGKEVICHLMFKCHWNYRRSELLVKSANVKILDRIRNKCIPIRDGIMGRAYRVGPKKPAKV